ncbi:hypothetical protein NIES267_62360 [Calothrix parasitica NIES-267]|uniref:Uncharacterized protein n=1 Tax=Calothrix parasitica NIES-267 TaxID=1973488 RepID=A0A1Z4LZR3_9CYAN|nr:hypothetical protein NIES267_62360 [Calothrix parasitica NIES-267]
MQPFRIVSNTINNNPYYRRFAQNPLVMNWGWLFSFLIISIFNGWMINVSQVDTSILPLDISADRFKQLIVIYFAIFPLAATVYIIFKNTAFLVVSLIGSRAILAVALCYLRYSGSNSLFMGFLGFNLLLFVFVLIFVCKTRGVVVPAFILFFTAVLALIGQGHWAFRIVWYCNLVVTVNKSGRQLRNALDSFDAAMLSLTGIAAVGLAIGWVMGGFSAV